LTELIVVDSMREENENEWFVWRRYALGALELLKSFWNAYLGSTWTSQKTNRSFKY
jgi:hypothetical protein